MHNYKIISADTHIVEPPDLYSANIDPKFRHLAPTMQRTQISPGRYNDAWFLGDKQVGSVAQFAQSGQRYLDPSLLDYYGIWEDVRKAGYDPYEMVKELEIDGVWGACLQPSQGLLWYMVPGNTSLLNAICQAYNQWIAEFCKPYLGRLKPIGCINIDDVAEGCQQLRVCADLGLAAVFIPTYPHPDRRYNQDIYEDLWRTAEGLDMPLLLHVGAVRGEIPGCELSSNITQISPAARVTLDHWVRYSLTDMLFSGIFDRYPELRIGSVEHEMAWVPHWIKMMDFVYRERRVFTKGWTSTGGFLPSDYWRRNMFVEFMEDDIGLYHIDIIGENNILWGNDFPHAESTWPKSMEFLDRALSGTSSDIREKITSGNAARIFGFGF